MHNEKIQVNLLVKETFNKLKESEQDLDYDIYNLILRGWINKNTTRCTSK